MEVNRGSWRGETGRRHEIAVAKVLTGGSGREAHAEGPEKGTSGILDPMAGRSGFGRCW